VDLSDVLRPACQLPARYFNPVQWEQWHNEPNSLFWTTPGSQCPALPQGSHNVAAWEQWHKEQDPLFWTTPGAQCPALPQGSRKLAASIFYGEDGVQNNKATQQPMSNAQLVASSMALSDTINTLQCPLQPQGNKSVSRVEQGV